MRAKDKSIVLDWDLFSLAISNIMIVLYFFRQKERSFIIPRDDVDK